MDDLDCSLSISSLICEEDESILNVTNVNCSNIFGSDDDEYIEILASTESSSFFTSGVTDDHLKWARSEAIQWILKTRAFFSFSYQTAYLAVTYYDRFLTRRSFNKGKSWVVRLLSIGCLSLAAKMEECVVPALSEYQTEDECRLDSNAIQRMELLILSTLEWRMSAVTPFAYLSYFTNKLQSESESDQLVSKSIGFIFAVLGEINVVDQRPSTIAAAAVLAAFDHGLNKQIVESKLSIFASRGALALECVFSCYTMMIEESVKCCSGGGDSNSSISYTTSSNKRRRLEP